MIVIIIHPIFFNFETGVDRPTISNPSDMIRVMNESIRQPCCFMNLACFLDLSPANPLALNANVNAALPTVAFACESTVLGVMGPSGITTANLLHSLKGGHQQIGVVSEVSIQDLLNFADAVVNSLASETSGRNSGEGGSDARDSMEEDSMEVEVLMAKMMLATSVMEIVGTLIQAPVPADTTDFEIGDKAFSTAFRCILIIDRALNLDAQSLYITLRLVRKLAAKTKMAVVLLIEKEHEQIGLFGLTDMVLVFNYEGLFYFGPSPLLEAYCQFIELPCPPSVHIIGHVHSLMAKYSPSSYKPDPLNIATPFTVRYNFSSVAKFNSAIVNSGVDATVGHLEEGLLSARLVPLPSNRKSRSISNPPNSSVANTLSDPVYESLHRAEITRQKRYEAKQLESERESERESEFRKALEPILRILPELTAASETLTNLNDIARQMAEKTKPVLFFNLASFLEVSEVHRVDVLQPVCGFACSGRIIGVFGPPPTTLQPFATALAAPDTPRSSDPLSPRTDSSESITVANILEFGSVREDLESVIAQALSPHMAVTVGQLIRRIEQQTKSGDQIIIVLDKVSTKLPVTAWVALMAYLWSIAPSKGLAVLVNLIGLAERRCLFTLVHDCLIFDERGVGYFGPATCLNSYLTIQDFGVPQGTHPIDHLLQLLVEYSSNVPRVVTNTTPAVRYKFSPLAQYVENLATAFQVDMNNDAPQDSEAKKKRLPFIPRKKRRSTKVDSEDSVRKAAIAAAEAEAEGQRIAEAEAELVWRKMQEME
eukprot:c19091_g1_i2.p1 GENE.c19091_g1_i2~~c19091_g1_i2.p1  ORF type:complete len:770 (+),score=188.24 c19091_g1_i2:67-2376(+)